MQGAGQTPAALYGRWFQETARRLREADPLPGDAQAAARRAAEIRRRIRAAEGAAFPSEAERGPVDVDLLGSLERDGYRVDRLLFQTRPGVYATANVYVPTTGGPRFPAVLCVHGHWAGARRDPVVQSRCIGLAKLGFLALTLDAWGAGERGTRVGQNEYHGGLLGASLWPVGTPLHGLQLYDNLRALDYLQSRPDVDRDRIGCTGASGGGNQTTYLSAFDERVRCAVPVCSVGTFRSYLQAACCVDEVLNGALTFAEEGDLLGIVAPRALMVITASQDVSHFAPGAAGEALDRARPYFRVHGAEERVRHVVVESGHAYNQPMREAMYGWMRRWLRNEGDGSPTPEPTISPEDPEAIRCFTPPFRSGKVTTTIQWVRDRAEELAEAVPLPHSVAEWKTLRAERVARLSEILALPADRDRPPFPPEAVTSVELPQGSGKTPLVLLLHPSGREAALKTSLAETLRREGVGVAALDLRGCGELTLPNQGLGDTIPDHNLVEWSLWIGRPLLGQWVEDVLRFQREGLPDRVPADRVVVVGWREAGLAALLAGALGKRFRGVAAVEALASYRSETVPHQQRMVVFQPDLLRVGDVPHLAALAAPGRVLIANPLRLDGMAAPASEVEALHAYPRRVHRLLEAEDRFTATASLGDAELAREILRWTRG